MSEALAAVYPETTLQTCIVHLMRNSLEYAGWKERKSLAAAIRPIYTAASAEAAEAELGAFADGPWGQKFPTVVASRRRGWSNVIPFFAFPPAVRRVIYTTDEIDKRDDRNSISHARVTAGRSAAHRLQALPRSQLTEFASDLRRPCSSPWAVPASGRQTGRRHARLVRPSYVRARVLPSGCIRRPSPGGPF